MQPNRRKAKRYQTNWKVALVYNPPLKKPVIEAVDEVAVVVRDGARVLVIRRGVDERWAGLWDFVRFSVPNEKLRELIDSPSRVKPPPTCDPIRCGAINPSSSPSRPGGITCESGGRRAQRSGEAQAAGHGD